MPRKPSKTKKRKQKPIEYRDDLERAVAEAAIRAVREGRVEMQAARDPKTYTAAYAKVYAGADEVTRVALEGLEDEEEEEPDVVVVDGVKWRAAVTAAAT